MRHVPSPVSSLLAILLVSLPLAAEEPPTPSPENGLTAVPGLRVGHHVLEARPTGCTVIVAPEGTVGAVDVRGGAPGSRELALLAPWNLVQHVDAVVLAGGSAFGLDAAAGAVRWLEEQGRGYDAGVARVPIVPAAILFDLAVRTENGDASVRPGPDCGYRAAAAASGEPVAEGNAGAGAGATVGKLAGPERAMKGGLGSYALVIPARDESAESAEDDADDADDAEPLVVAALAAVNALGDVIDPATGEVVAGVRTAEGDALADARHLLLTGGLRSTPESRPPGSLDNTTLVVVATNARLDKTAAHKVAQMAHDGLARAISPVHTPFDGDTVFVLATGSRGAAVETSDLLRIGTLAAEATARAVVRGVRAAEGLPGLPAASDRAPSDRAASDKTPSAERP